MARSRVWDPLQVSRFHVLDVGWTFPPVLIPVFGFARVQLPTVTIEMMEIKEGNYEFPRKVVKKAATGNIRLEQGVTLFNSDFWNWVNNSVTGQADPRNLLIVQFTGMNPKKMISGNKALNAIGSAANLGSGVLGGFKFEEDTRLPGRAWVCSNCRPVMYKPGSDFDAMSGEISIASLELSVEEFEEFSMGF